MPSSHKVYNDWNPLYFEQRASAIGASTLEYIRRLIAQYNYPELAYKQAQGILSYAKAYGATRLNNACKRALLHHWASYQTISNILKNGLDNCIFRGCWFFPTFGVMKENIPHVSSTDQTQLSRTSAA